MNEELCTCGHSRDTHFEDGFCCETEEDHLICDCPVYTVSETRIEKRLKSIVCVCDKPKQKGKPFCRKCFTKLPDDLKQRLSNQLVEDFLVAYDEAKTQLQSN